VRGIISLLIAILALVTSVTASGMPAAVATAAPTISPRAQHPLVELSSVRWFAIRTISPSTALHGDTSATVALAHRSRKSPVAEPAHRRRRPPAAEPAPVAKAPAVAVAVAVPVAAPAPAALAMAVAEPVAGPSPCRVIGCVRVGGRARAGAPDGSEDPSGSA